MYGNALGTPALAAGGGSLAATGAGLGPVGILTLAAVAAALVTAGLFLRRRAQRR
ncbi:hypothetical protein GCM10009801_53280 [Streptomyces albiaxialis]|uniref:Gram-positive cocci surface proteins LPxTG domain-containing protein n=1 Tax=Streptomyces albiaxialis TaxID=329523 RepID=A0ABN2WCX2_9ACTN